MNIHGKEKIHCKAVTAGSWSGIQGVVKTPMANIIILGQIRKSFFHSRSKTLYIESRIDKISCCLANYYCIFPGRIFFTSGRIHPKIILNQYEYNLVHQKVSSNKSLWICTKKGQLKCKARLQSFGKCIRVKSVQHNHPSTYEGDFSTLKSQIVNIEYTSNRFT